MIIEHVRGKRDRKHQTKWNDSFRIIMSPPKHSVGPSRCKSPASDTESATTTLSVTTLVNGEWTMSSQWFVNSYFTNTEQLFVILCCVSISARAGSQSVTLQATSEVVASCGDNVTLTCNATSSHKLDVKYFAWHREKNVCQHDGAQPDGAQPDPAVRCASREEASHHTLTLTLVNVMPVHEGRYLCKLRSNQGVGSASAVLTVQGEPASHFKNAFILSPISFLTVSNLHRLPRYIWVLH